MQKLLSQFNSYIAKLLYYLLLFIVVFVPLYPKFPLLSVTGTFVAIRLEDIVIAAFLLIFSFYLLTLKKLKVFLTSITFLTVITFLFIGLLSVASSILLTHTVIPHLAILHLLRRIELMVLLPVTACLISSKKQLKQFLIIISAVVLLVCIYALGQKYLDWPIISTTNSEFSKGLILHLTKEARVSSTFAGHYDLAIFLMAVLIMIVSLLNVIKTIWGQLWITIIGGLSTVVLIMTAARLSFIACVIGILLALVLTNKKKLIALILIVVVAVVVYPSPLRDRFLSTIQVNIENNQQSYIPTQAEEERNRLNIPTLPKMDSSTSASQSALASQSAGLAPDIAPGEPRDYTQLTVSRSSLIRFKVEWPRALRAFIKNPLLGTGYSSIGIATDNDLLRSLGEVGLLGTISFALIFVHIYKRVVVGIKTTDRLVRSYSIGVLSLTAAYLINALVIDVFEASKIATLFWITVGANLGILNLDKD